MKKQPLLVYFVLLVAFSFSGCAPEVPVTTPVVNEVPPVETIIIDEWNDRAIFRAGLISSEQKTLEQLPQASVYHIDVQLADDYQSLRGQERVRYTNQEDTPLDAVYFQLFPNQLGGRSSVSTLSVDGGAVQPVYEAENSTLRVPLPVPLQPDASVVIELNFLVELPADPGGNYGLLGYMDGILVLDGFYPAIPVYDADGWHAGPLTPNADTTFQDASFYVVRVTAPAELTLITSGVQVERSEPGGYQMVTFAAGPARDFYIAASDRFTRLSVKIGETTVNSYAFKDRGEGSQLALDTAARAIRAFSERFGTYPYTEFDVVSTPMQGATGIEYPGITGINKTVYDPAETVSGAPAFVILEATVAHEVGHQWFYNLVGNDQANQPWLDEAVTQYATGLYFLDQSGAQGMESYRDSWLSRWDRVEQAAIPIGLPAGSYQGREYGAIVYGRGPLFVEALAQTMGQPAFDQFMQDYCQTFQWNISTEALFKQLAEQHCQCDLTPLFVEWVNPE